MAKKVLVTGGTGFIGSSLIRGLLAAGYDVRCFDNNSRGNVRKIADIIDHIEYVEGDIRSFWDVHAATKGVDVVANLAFINGTKFFYENPRLVLEVGIQGAMNTLQTAIDHGVSEYWYMSSSEVYQTPPTTPTDENVPMSIPDPRNPRYSYGGAKLISEILAFNYGRGNFEKTVVVRPHNVYGPDMGWEHVIPDFICRVKDQMDRTDCPMIEFPIQGSGKQRRSFCYIDDFVDGCLRAFIDGEDQQIYHVGAPFEYTVENLAYVVCAKMGRLPSIIPGPEPKGGTYMRIPDITKVQKLGYEPKIDLGEGLDRTIEWYKANFHLRPTLKP